MAETDEIVEIFEEGKDLPEGFFREETAFLHIFFKNEFVIQYKRDRLYGINDFIC